MRTSLALLAACLASADGSAVPSLRGGAANATLPEAVSSDPAVADASLAANRAVAVANETASVEEVALEDGVPLELLQGRHCGASAPELCKNGGWFLGGDRDKMWGFGAGVEVIDSSNIAYYDHGMAEAHSRCGGADCVLIVNPPGHRTKEQFHIWFFQYDGLADHHPAYGANLKEKVESRVCGKPGWHAGGLPCHGQAAFFPGFPDVFSKAANTSEGVRHASVIAWPGSCGGTGTIVQLAYGCSIEHQIKGDFDARYR